MMRKLLRRIRNWVVGPGGWLFDEEVNAECSAIDVELDALQEHEDWVNALHHHLDERTGRVVTTPFKIDRGPRRE